MPPGCSIALSAASTAAENKMHSRSEKERCSQQRNCCMRKKYFHAPVLQNYTGEHAGVRIMISKPVLNLIAW